MFPIRFLTGMVALTLRYLAIAEEKKESSLVLQPVSVTGYHITRIDTQGPAPLVVITRTT